MQQLIMTKLQNFRKLGIEFLLKLKIKNSKKKEFQNLSETAENYLNQYPNSAEIKAWAGIILSTEAGFYKLNIPKAIKKITRAKDVLEQGLDLDPKTLDGGIYSSLGLIYLRYQETIRIWRQRVG